MIVMRDVEKAYETRAGRIWALRRINLEIRDGEFVALVGGSGAGKSALLAIMALLDGDWGGEYFFLGEAVHRLGTHERLALHNRSLGFVSRQAFLIDALTVAENLDFSLSHRGFGRARRRRLVARALERFQIAEWRDLLPSRLSGGQRQVVAVARAGAGDPRVILADELGGGLSSEEEGVVTALLAGLNREGVTVVQATRNRELASFGRRNVELRNGWIERPAGAGTESELLPVTPPSWQQSHGKGVTIALVDGRRW